KDHHRTRVAGENIVERLKQERFFIVNRAAANNDRRRGRGRKSLPKTSHNRRCWRKGEVEFQISADLNAIGGSPNFDQAIAVLFGLRNKNINVGQNSL